MKTLLGLMIVVACTTMCLAQGKVGFANNSVHLVYYDSSCGPLAGSGVSSASMPPGVTMVADLYAGAGSGSLSMVTTVTFGPTPGRWNSSNVLLPNLPGGTNRWFQVQVRDSSFSNAVMAASAGSYVGFSEVFSMVPGTAIVYSPIYQNTAPALSTWAPGTYNLDSIAAGSLGAIAVVLGTPGPPIITVQPVGKIVPVGGGATLSAQAVGFPPLTYQWYFGTNSIDGATNASVTFTNMQTTQSGQYSVVVTSPGGSKTSDPATLSVLATLDVRMVPAISLYGTVGKTYTLQYINIGDQPPAWTDLATITITNTGQLYFDLTSQGQSIRYYRLVEVP